MRREWVVLLIGILWVSSAQAEGFQLTSPQLRDGGNIADEQVFNGFGCTGGNVSPELAWTSPPAGTQSLAVTVYDPDAPTGSGWWHWVIFNIPAGTSGLAKNAGDPKSGLAPAGSVQSRTDFGAPGYGGPCPPAGDAPHHYIFTVYALKTPKLDLDSQASGAMVGFFLKGNSLGEASLTGLYER
ncbi:MAG: YbhB/YbcL family Raf kinase inhibitor-like protein [Proteobacteria bacterium]|nr:YbhB/YbcL family Raf kinase inhibitor-like protein [Pseudomonadota bacterium]